MDHENKPQIDNKIFLGLVLPELKFIVCRQSEKALQTTTSKHYLGLVWHATFSHRPKKALCDFDDLHFQPALYFYFSETSQKIYHFY